MTRISQIKAEHQLDSGGTWLHWRGTIHFCVIGFLSREYQRALRIIKAEHPSPNGELEGLGPREREAKLVEYEERLGAALVPQVGHIVLRDWWGIDAESEPTELWPEEGEPAPVPKLIAEVGSQKLLTLEHGGKLYRPEGALWQEMVPYSPEAAVAMLSDPACFEVLIGVREAARAVDMRRVTREIELMGKPSSTSSGKSVTATTPNG